MSAASPFRIGDFSCTRHRRRPAHLPRSGAAAARGEPACRAGRPVHGAAGGHRVSQRVLIDMGAGPLGPETGRLPQSLAAAGVALDDIDLVVLSHAHADHIGQVLPRAEYVMLRTEWDFWTDEATHAKLAAGTLYGVQEVEQAMSAWIRHVSRARARPHPAARRGHRGRSRHPRHPGTRPHARPRRGADQLGTAATAVRRRRGRAPRADGHPEWTTPFDLDPAQTVRTRRQLLDRAAADRCLVFPFHFPLPCVGEVSARKRRLRMGSFQSVASTKCWPRPRSRGRPGALVQQRAAGSVVSCNVFRARVSK
jgi:glyoxylase-like metal-dependent hydrolase (beta-lactamase superfamily II)